MDLSLTSLEQPPQKRVRRLAEEQIAPIAAEAGEPGGRIAAPLHRLFPHLLQAAEHILRGLRW
jgi:hypothetical protein